MNILIATPLYPPEIGGPAQYAKNLEREFFKKGHAVKVIKYGLEKKLPAGVSHFVYFFRLLRHILTIDLIIALDTFSVGLPAVLAANIFHKRALVRIGGDFLWEAHTERTRQEIILSEFYQTKKCFNFKEKLIFRLTKYLTKRAGALVFNTDWQRKIWQSAYFLPAGKTRVIENFYGAQVQAAPAEEKNFIFAARPLFLKNGARLARAFAKAKEQNPEIRLDAERAPHERLMEKIKHGYAVILPSLSDVAPNLILDAIRFNKPFIMTRESGLYGKLEDIGLFVDPLVEEDIKNKILWLADDKNYQAQQSRVAGFNFTHSWSQIADEFLSAAEAS